MARKSDRRLYRGESGRETRRRFVEGLEREGYSPRRAESAYGATVGKVARERAADEGGTYREYVEPHLARSDRGRRFRVKGHTSIVHAHPHAADEHHHRGPCGPGCRRGATAHRHTARRRKR